MLAVRTDLHDSNPSFHIHGRPILTAPVWEVRHVLQVLDVIFYIDHLQQGLREEKL